MEVDPPRYLIDTNVISAVAPTKKEPPLATMVHWLGLHTDRLFLSAVTIAELTDGVAKLRRKGATHKAARLDDWLGLVLHLYADRVLPLDLHVAKTTGQFSDLARGQGHAPGFADLAIAATASTHELVLLTRNVRHFEFLPVEVVDPFADLPNSPLAPRL
ncbi:type II toxin-antitoxin system VapC family toxin [Geminicoccus flavidas]|uniref:type II toxin-antitoxin system VapC family toxin n=1 Tax=Geminicoccus flavidas TaxID=2506407 RepID=UPI00135ADEF1|nr:type II toxin-antitoxin system VapC family toxin [Geminicoccus flavidas]